MWHAGSGWESHPCCSLQGDEKMEVTPLSPHCPFLQQTLWKTSANDALNF
jgi:hypothetical protein